MMTIVVFLTLGAHNMAVSNKDEHQHWTAASRYVSLVLCVTFEHCCIDTAITGILTLRDMRRAGSARQPGSMHATPAADRGAAGPAQRSGRAARGLLALRARGAGGGAHHMKPMTSAKKTANMKMKLKTVRKPRSLRAARAPAVGRAPRHRPQQAQPGPRPARPAAPQRAAACHDGHCP